MHLDDLTRRRSKDHDNLFKIVSNSSSPPLSLPWPCLEGEPCWTTWGVRWGIPTHETRWVVPGSRGHETPRKARCSNSSPSYVVLENRTSDKNYNYNNCNTKFGHHPRLNSWFLGIGRSDPVVEVSPLRTTAVEFTSFRHPTSPQWTSTFQEET